MHMSQGYEPLEMWALITVPELSLGEACLFSAKLADWWRSISSAHFLCQDTLIRTGSLDIRQYYTLMNWS
jgi:hypothetical protein